MLRKQFAFNVLIFSFGFICGAITLMVIGSIAYDSYLYGMKAQFRGEQTLKYMALRRFKWI